MVVPVFDFWTILLVTILDTIIDLIVFKLFRVRDVTVLVTLLLDFVIPYILFLVFIFSRPPLEQQIPAITDFIGNMLVNLVNFTTSAVFGYIITAFIYILSGGRTEEPEF